MLNFLQIDNFALIPRSEVEFAPGFNVITGESGAGKSILIGALGFLLGGRAARTVIRAGENRCAVSAIFTVPENLRPRMAELLENAGVPFDAESGELALRRVITASAGRCFVNDTPVGVPLLAEAGSLLVDRQQVNEQLSLQSPARQLELLDRYAGAGALRARCAVLCAEIAALRRERDSFNATLVDPSEADRLHLMLEEIAAVNPEPGEDESLSGRHKLAANAQSVLSIAQELNAQLADSEESLADQLGSVYRKLLELEHFGVKAAAEMAESCAGVQEEIEQLSRRIADEAGRVDLDPAELAAIEERLSAVTTLKRRYGPTLELLFEHKAKAEETLNAFSAAAARRAEFDAQEKALQKELGSAAAELSGVRKKAAGHFTECVRKKLEHIGFNGSALEAEFTAAEPGPTGADRMELLFSANAGVAVQPLRKIASSGELARLMLALKTVLADADDTPTVIFDEIDMNIGGETANAVGDELRELGKQHQIILISHLAQVASRAGTHFQVGKHTVDGRTESEIRKLADPVPELARMLGGGDEALRHAKTLTAKTRRSQKA